MTISAAALVAILALAPLDDKPGAKDGGAAGLQGTWAGKAGPDGRSDIEIEFKGPAVALTITRDGQKRTGRGTFKLDEAAKPRALDLVDFRMPEDVPPQPSPPFIYALEGDSLKLCGAGAPDQPRPTEFKSAGTGPARTVLIELTRKRPAK